MKNKKCEHTSFWQIYKLINFNRVFGEKKGVSFKCEICNEKCSVKWKGYKKQNQSFMKRLGSYFVWFLPAFILIALVANKNLNFLIAIGIITAFHFAAMYFIIKSDRLHIKEK